MRDELSGLSKSPNQTKHAFPIAITKKPFLLIAKH